MSKVDLPDAIENLISHYGMTKLLGALIDYTTNLDPAKTKPKYLTGLIKDLTAALKNYEKRHSKSMGEL